MQSILNRLGFRTNLLYDLLKEPSARTVEPFRQHPAQTLAMLAALPLVVPLGFALFLFEVLLRRGGTVEVYARKVDDLERSGNGFAGKPAAPDG
jgi:hypothetical protein